MTNKTVFASWLMVVGASLAAVGAHAAGPTPTPAPAQAQPQAQEKGERISIDTLKEKYWTKGDEAQLRVVQNRLYSKSGKLEIGGFVGAISTDPFLSVKNAGGSLGVHLNEYFAISALGWKSFATPSSALETLESQNHVTANTNQPKQFIGGEVAFSPLYGKLSLVGRAIIYFDMHVTAGVGSTKTETGDYVTPFIGIGQQIYLNSFLSLRLDYRGTYYKETIREKSLGGTALGQELGSNENFSNVVTLGLTGLIGLWN